jgi:hypothetical protein
VKLENGKEKAEGENREQRSENGKLNSLIGAEIGNSKIAASQNVKLEI